MALTFVTVFSVDVVLRAPTNFFGLAFPFYESVYERR